MRAEGSRLAEVMPKASRTYICFLSLTEALHVKLPSRKSSQAYELTNQQLSTLGLPLSLSNGGCSLYSAYRGGLTTIRFVLNVTHQPRKNYAVQGRLG